MKKILFLLFFLITQNSFSCPGTGNWNMNSSSRNSMMRNWMKNSNMPKSQKKGWMGCQMSMVRHHYYMQNGLPSNYSDLKNPVEVTPKVISSGKKIFENNCMACHGKNGLGYGQAAKNLKPRPTNIARFAKMPMASDSYLFWTISEGGEKIDTAMPSYKEGLNKKEIWAVIHYLRNL